MSDDKAPPIKKFIYWIVAWVCGILSVGGLWLEASGEAANRGPGYIIAGMAIIVFVIGLVASALDDERYPPKKPKE